MLEVISLGVFVQQRQATNLGLTNVAGAVSCRMPLHHSRSSGGQIDVL